LTTGGSAAARRPTCDTPPIALYSLLYDLLRLVIEILILRGRGDAELRAEVLALRHQLRGLRSTPDVALSSGRARSY
jgi:hypothetical protein